MVAYYLNSQTLIFCLSSEFSQKFYIGHIKIWKKIKNVMSLNILLINNECIA